MKNHRRHTERDTAERTMRELADVLSQDAGPIADVPFTLQPETPRAPRERQRDLFGTDEGQDG